MYNLGELHSILSKLIGDPVNVDFVNNIIPDGVRFFRDARTHYLQRALDEIQGQLVQQLITLPPEIKSSVAYQLFPTTIKKTRVAVNTTNWNNDLELLIPELQDNNIKAVSFIAATLYQDYTDVPFESQGIYPLPIKDAVAANALVNSRNVQRPDPFVTPFVYIGNDNRVYNTLKIYYPSDAVDGDTVEIEVTYIPAVQLLNTLNVDDIVIYENIYLNQAIVQASMYAKQDSQEEIMQQGV
jgi:hypothetical protein